MGNGSALSEGAKPSAAPPRSLFEAEHEEFRDSVRRFIAKEAVPRNAEWEAAGMVDRDFWRSAASLGFVGFELPEAVGGLGIEDFRFNAVIDEEVAYAGAVGDNFSLQNDIIVPYLLELADESQLGRWGAGFTAGDLVLAIAMSEPGAGSDLRAMSATLTPDGDEYVLEGSKTFVTSGIQADLVIVAARGPGDGYSLVVVEAGAEGFQRGRKLEKVGRKAQDTAELFFDRVRVPAANLLGEPGRGLHYLMAGLPRERLSIAVSAVAAAEHALDLTLGYVGERTAFGRPIGSFQANRFSLAEAATQVAASRAFVDQAIASLNAGTLSAAAAAGVKAQTTAMQFEVLDLCLQLHGGYGYMDEYEISRLWRDARVQRIYGGTNEVMLEIVGRSLGL
jgi:alkylation response protein AidB-like acyl-CoA dehydrogenase